jgi:hypothetical protein
MAAQFPSMDGAENTIPIPCLVWNVREVQDRLWCAIHLEMASTIWLLPLISL